MLLERISVLLVLVAASGLTLGKPEVLRGHKVFPDDLARLPIHGTGHSVDSPQESTNCSTNCTVCQTKECRSVAREFLNSMDKSKDPCDNFYEYTCGAWTNESIPPNMPYWSRYLIFDKTVKSRIKAILEAPPEFADILPLRQAKKWYQSCMDSENLERRDINPIESVLMQAGGWPIAMDEEEWDGQEQTWQKIVAHYTRLIGANAFFRVVVKPPVGKDSKFGTLVVNPPEQTLLSQLPENYRNYSGNDYETYIDIVESVAELFIRKNRARVPRQRLMLEAIQIVEFEKELFRLVNEYVASPFHVVAFKDLDKWYDALTEPGIAAKVELKTGIERLFRTANIQINPETKTTMINPAYFQGLARLLRNTPERIIINYVHWTFVGSMLIYTTEEVRNVLLSLVFHELGIKERHPRWYECVQDMKMRDAAAYEFVNKYFTKETDSAVREMVKNIQNEMEEKISNAIWMDEESKAIAKEKLKNMKIFVGFPEWYKNQTAIINAYKGLTIGADYFDNVMGYMRYMRKKELKKYVTHQEAGPRWNVDATDVNAVYSFPTNSLNLPAVDFQAPLFTGKLPNSVNYGTAGVLVGHEMGHGFDDTGIKFGKDGDATPLSEKILKSYYQRADCFTTQFEDYFREDGSTDGTNKPDQAVLTAMRTRGENIADTTGIQAVFQAYKRLNKSKDDVRLPGLEEFTEDQLFFLSFAAMWCKVETPEFKQKLKEAGDPHSPTYLRVIGSISNSKAFAKAFNCPEGSGMNPANKCNIWDRAESSEKAKRLFMSRGDHLWKSQWNI